jgi:protein adenylyltransferase
VLNSDNLSILGVTIDYGPFGFMEYFDNDHICNSSDNNGRYSYKQQPSMCRFDLKLLGEALFRAVGLPDEDVEEYVGQSFDEEFQQAKYALFRWKLGLLTQVEREFLQVFFWQRPL